jgi:hypothetical protein
MATFCSAYDEHLAHHGPAGVFLPDREGELRFDAEWSRNAWESSEGPHAHGFTWTLLRDRDTGFVMLALATSPTVLTEHARMDVRACHDEAEARAVRAGFGNPPLCSTPW